MRKIQCSTTGEVCTSYKSYLSSYHWKNVKLAFRRSPQFKNKCFVCNAPNLHASPINIHHRSYANVGKELSQDLVELCPMCHGRVHQIAKKKAVKMGDICFAVEYLKHDYKKNGAARESARAATRYSPPGVVVDLIKRLHELRAEVMGVKCAGK